MPTTITPIGPAPTVPDSSIDEPVFDVQQENFYRYEAEELAPKVNALGLATYNNAVESVAAAAAAVGARDTALALTNFKGSWAALPAEPLAKPASVEKSGSYWMLLNDIADPTVSVPGISADWAIVPGYFAVGDVVTTVRALTAPTWLRGNAAVYAKASYPLLAPLLPTAITPPTYRLGSPAALPAGGGTGTAFSSDGVYLAVVCATAPYVAIYKRAGDVFTKLADPASLPAGAASGVAFSQDGTYLAVAHATTPFVTIYKRAGDVFTKLANPASLPAGSGADVAFSQDGTYLAVAHTTTPFVTIFKRDGDVFTKLANPASLPAGNATDVAFSPDGTYLAVAHGTTPFVTIYKRDGDVFTKLANPASLPAGNATDVAFSPDGTYLAVAHATTPFVTVYKRAGDVFTKLADPATLPASTAYAVAFSPDGAYLAVAHSSTPFITVYERAGDVFTKMANPASLPAGNGTALAFFKGAAHFEYMLAIAVDATPYFHVYRDAYPFDPLTEFAVPNYPGLVGDPAKTYIRGA